MFAKRSVPQRILGVLLSVLMVLALVPSSVAATGEAQVSHIGFTSDVHSKTADLSTWLDKLTAPDSGAAVSSLDHFIFGGDFDYTPASVHTTADTCVAMVEAAFGGTPVYTAKGNHDGDAGEANYGNVGTAPLESPGTIGYNQGLVYSGSDYAVYVIDSIMTASYQQYFSQTDIDNLPGVLAGIDPSIPIFVISHFPIHYLSTLRSTVNAEELFDVLKDYANVVFLWGHNHSQNDPEYGIVRTASAGDTIQFTSDPSDKEELTFTYASMGAIYNNVLNKGAYGLLATVENLPGSSTVTLEYKNLGGVTVSGDSVTIPGSNEIPAVALSDIAVPVGGNTPDTEAAASAGVTSPVPVSWFEGTSPFTGAFAAGTEYTACMTLSPSGGRVFAASPAVTVNGNDAAGITPNGDGTLTVTHAFTAQEPAVVYTKAAALADGREYAVVMGGAAMSSAPRTGSSSSFSYTGLGYTAPVISGDNKTLTFASAADAAASTWTFTFSGADSQWYISNQGQNLYAPESRSLGLSGADRTAWTSGILSGKPQLYATLPDDNTGTDKQCKIFYGSSSTVDFFYPSVNNDGDLTFYEKPFIPSVPVDHIAVTRQPDKTAYTAGEAFDAAGMEVTAFLTDSTSVIVTGYTVTPGGPLTTADTSVTVAYLGKTDTVMISVSPSAGWDGSIATAFGGGSGAPDDPYLISTAPQLAYLAQEVNDGVDYSGRFFRQTADLDLGSREWTPIGIYISSSSSGGSAGNRQFAGTYDGDGFIISNLKIAKSFAGSNTADSPSKVYALFAYVSGTIKNVGLTGISVDVTNTNSTSSNSNVYAGGLVGNAASGSSLLNSYAANGTVRATASYSSARCYAGGLVVYFSGGTVTNCYAAVAAAVSGSGSNAAAGGLSGTSSGTFSSSYWDSELTANGVGSSSTTSGTTGKSTDGMKAPAFPAQLNTGVTESKFWMADLTPALNGGYPVHFRDPKIHMVTGITVKTPPAALSYAAGQAFDPAGMVITVAYSDLTAADITSGYTYSPSGALAASDTQITISYGGKTAAQAISVIRPITYKKASAITSGREYAVVLTNTASSSTFAAMNNAPKTGTFNNSTYTGLDYVTPAIDGDYLTFASPADAAASTWTFTSAGTGLWIIGNGSDCLRATGGKTLTLADSTQATAWTYGSISSKMQLYITSGSTKYSLYFGKGSTVDLIYPSSQTGTLALYEKISLEGITVSGQKTAYASGEAFDPAGMTVTAHYTDGFSAAVSDYTYDPAGPLTGDTTVTVRYTENGVTVTASFPVTVAAPADTALSAVSGTGTYGEAGTLTATLKAGDTPVASKTVIFTHGGTVLGSAETDANGVAVCAAADLTGIAAGTYPDYIAASFSGDAGFTGSTAAGSLSVLRRAVTVSADPKSKVYGQANPALTWSITNGSLAVGDALSGELLRTAGEYAGSYEIFQNTLTASPNYQLTFEGAFFTIEKRAVTVSVHPLSIVYGASEPVLTPVVVNGSFLFADGLAGAVLRDPGNDAGRYTIRQGSLTAGPNYEMTFVLSYLDITPKPIVVTADAGGKEIGSGDPALTYTCSEAGVAFTGGLERENGEDIGTYAINQGTLDAGGNYAVTFVPALFTITEKDLTGELKALADLMTVTGSVEEGIAAVFPEVIDDITALDFKINTHITLNSPLPEGSLVSVSMNDRPPVTRDPNDLTDLTPGDGKLTFSFTEFFGVDAAGFTGARYSHTIETYHITVTGNPAAINTAITLKTFLFKAGSDDVILEEASFPLTVPIDTGAALEAVRAGMTITGGFDDVIVAAFPSVPPEIAELGYKINTLITLGGGQTLPAGSTVTASMAGGPTVTRDMSGMSSFTFTELFGVDAADFDTDYSGRVERYTIGISGNSSAIDAQLTLKTYLFKDGSTVVLEEASFDLTVAKDMTEALNAVIQGTTISGNPVSGIVAQFPAVIPADVASAGYKINSLITLGAPLPADARITITLNGLPYLTDFDLNGRTSFKITELFAGAVPAPFDTGYNNRTETYRLAITGTATPVNTVLTLKSIISNDDFATSIVLESKTFSLVTHAVSFTAGAHGSLTGTVLHTPLDGTDWADALPVPPVPVADTGYHFTGWTPVFPATVTGPAAFTAGFTADTYHISYILSGGTNNDANPAAYTYGIAVTLAEPDRIGHAFGGWYGDIGLTAPASGISAADTGDKTFYAKWTVKNYSITYVLGDGVNNPANPATYAFGSSVTLASPSRTGHTFGGWFSDAGLTTAAADIGADDTGSKIFYAKWTINTYTVSFSTDGGSAVTAITQNYNTLIATAPVSTKTGHTLEGWYTENTRVNKVSFPYTITGDVTLYAKWTPSGSSGNGGTGNIPAGTGGGGAVVLGTASKAFADVREGDWYYDAVQFVVSEGLFGGTSAQTFEPGTPMTRAMLATVLYRLEGKPAVSGPNPFKDVPAGAWYTSAVLWAKQNGIATGFNDGTFKPDQNLTREQLADFLYNYAKYKGYDLTPGKDFNLQIFKDASKIAEYTREAMKWACGAGLIKGKPGNLLAPKDSASRAEVATILKRFIEELGD